MTLKDALVCFGASGFVSMAALGSGSSLLPSTILVFLLLAVAFALVALVGAGGTVGISFCRCAGGALGAGGTVGACGALFLACVLPLRWWRFWVLVAPLAFVLPLR